MNRILFPTVRPALFAALALLAAAPAHASPVAYAFTVGSGLSGTFQYDDSAVTDNGDGTYTSPLTGFSFSYGGVAYTLADAADLALAWFFDPGQALVGIQYQAAAFEFTAGFGDGDLGLFTPNGGDSVQLTDASFAPYTPGVVPEPGTLALAGLGLAGLVGSFGRKRSSLGR